jgi:hypothetical protein
LVYCAKKNMATPLQTFMSHNRLCLTGWGKSWQFFLEVCRRFQLVTIFLWLDLPPLERTSQYVSKAWFTQTA